LWNATGDTVYFRIQDGVFASRLTARAASQPAFAPAVKLFAGDYLRPNFWNREMLYDASSRRFLMVRRLRTPEPVRQIRVVLNWENILEEPEAPRRPTG
jgi:hypothetical protein